MHHHATILGTMLVVENGKNAKEEFFFLQTHLMVSTGRWWEKSHGQLRKEKSKNRCHHQSSTASHQKVTSKKA